MFPCAIMNTSMTISCRSAKIEQREKASLLATKLRIPLATSAKNHNGYQLIYTDDRLELHGPSADNQQKRWIFYTDFIGGKSGFRRIHNTTIKQPIARAVGIKAGFRPTIVDATAGKGEDSFVFACLGCKVTLIERSSILSALLVDGLYRASQNPSISSIVENNMHVINGDAIDILGTIFPRPYTIYLDPMYPHQKKSALNKKEMRMIRAIVGDDDDVVSLLHQSLQSASNRVVVKRPKGAGTLSDLTPSHQIMMKNSRFDVYLVSPAA